MFRFLMAGFVVIALAIQASGQDAKKQSRFSAILDKIERSRSSVATAIFTMREIEISNGSVKIADEIIEFQHVVKRSWKVYADFSHEAFLISVDGDAIFFPATVSINPTSCLIRGPATFEINSLGELTERSPGLVSFSNPLIFGLGFCAELSRFRPFPEVISNVRTWDSDGTGIENKRTGPIEMFGLPLWGTEKFQWRIDIDTRRGYTPVWLEVWNDADPIVLAEINPLKKNGVWLPSSVAYFCSDDRYILKQFDWLMVNEPIPEGFFLPETISNAIATKNPTAFLVDGVDDDE